MKDIFGDPMYPYDNTDLLKRRRLLEHFHTPLRNKNQPFRTFLHYSDADAGKELDVFGAAKQGLFYNYDDRLIGSKWSEGWAKAGAAGLTPKTALWYEACLNHFHDTDTVDLQHVVLGCNRSNGFSYLIFGYTYTSAP